MTQLTKTGKGHYRKSGTGFRIDFNPQDRLWELTEHAHTIGKFRRMGQAEHRMNQIEINRLQGHHHAE